MPQPQPGSVDARRPCLFSLPRRSCDLSRQVEFKQILQSHGWMAAVRRVGQPDNVSDDLNWRQNQAERKAPPTEQRRICERLELFIARTETADEMIMRRPPGEDNHRKNAIRLIKINRPRLRALFAGTTVDSLDVGVNFLRIEAIEDLKQRSRLIFAFSGTIRVAILGHTEQTKALVAVVTDSHQPPPTPIFAPSLPAIWKRPFHVFADLAALT